MRDHTLSLSLLFFNFTKNTYRKFNFTRNLGFYRFAPHSTVNFHEGSFDLKKTRGVI